MNTQKVTHEDLLNMINKLAIQVRDDLAEHMTFSEDDDTLEAVKTIIKLAQLHEYDWLYPFNDGDTYYTIEYDTIEYDTIVESVWDIECGVSNKIFPYSHQHYFTSLDEAVKYFKEKSQTTPKISLL
jgi:hypothetical protein